MNRVLFSQIESNTDMHRDKKTKINKNAIAFMPKHIARYTLLVYDAVLFIIKAGPRHEKNVYALNKQQRHQSSCTPALSDQCCSVSVLPSIDEQAGSSTISYPAQLVTHV